MALTKTELESLRQLALNSIREAGEPPLWQYFC
jgi:hypothetical protein